LPVRGPPNRQHTSSIEAHTRSAPTRHSGTATSVVAVRSRSRRVWSASEGRTTVALRRIAAALAMRAMSTVEATPALRRDRAPHRDTVEAVRDHRTHPSTPNARASVAEISGAQTASCHTNSTAATADAAAGAHWRRRASTNAAAVAVIRPSSSRVVSSLTATHPSR
jgi:hypothetical protein